MSLVRMLLAFWLRRCRPELRVVLAAVVGLLASHCFLAWQSATALAQQPEFSGGAYKHESPSALPAQPQLHATGDVADETLAEDPQRTLQAGAEEAKRRRQLREVAAKRRLFYTPELFPNDYSLSWGAFASVGTNDVRTYGAAMESPFNGPWVFDLRIGYSDGDATGNGFPRWRGMRLGIQIGIAVASWPRHSYRAWSLLNPLFGPFFESFYGDGGDEGLPLGGGVYVANRLLFADSVALRCELRYAPLAGAYMARMTALLQLGLTLF